MAQQEKKDSTASLNQRLKNDDPDTDQEQDETEMLEYPSHEELEQKLTAAEEKASQNWDRMLRIQAEMDNLQRRVERDIANAHKYALEKFVLELLPIIDSLERAIEAHLNEDSASGSLLDGVSMTLKMLYAALEKFSVQQVNPERQPFNPEHHQAVSTQADPNVKPGTVLTVLQKGYLLNGRLIRPALVVVAK